MEMNYFRNILIVPTGLNKYVDIGMCFFSRYSLFKFNQSACQLGAWYVCVVQSSGLFIYYFVSCEIVFNFLNQITAERQPR